MLLTILCKRLRCFWNYHERGANIGSGGNLFEKFWIHSTFPNPSLWDHAPLKGIWKFVVRKNRSLVGRYQVNGHRGQKRRRKWLCADWTLISVPHSKLLGESFQASPRDGGKWAKNDLSKGASVSSRVLAFDRMLATIFNNQQEYQPIRNIPDMHNRGDHPQSCIVLLHRPRTAQLPAVGWPQQTTQAEHQLLSCVIRPHFWYDQHAIWVEPRPTDFCDWFFQDWEHIQEGQHHPAGPNFLLWHFISQLILDS